MSAKSSGAVWKKFRGCMKKALQAGFKGAGALSRNMKI